MKRPIIAAGFIAFILIFSNPLTVSAQDSLWAGNFGPTGIQGTVKSLGYWGDSLVIGGQITGIPYSSLTVHEFVIFDLVDRSWHRTLLGPEESGDEVRAFAEGPDGSLVIGGDFTFNKADTIFSNIAVLTKDGQWKTLLGGKTDGLDGPVNALFWHNGKLYIGGELNWLSFNDPFGFTIWDPDNGFETPLGLDYGYTSLNPIVNDFAYSDAHGNHLYLGGDFSYGEDGDNSYCVARYNIDSDTFESLPISVLGPVNAIYTANNLDWEDRLAVGGDFVEVYDPADIGPPEPCANLVIINFADTTYETPVTGTNDPVFVLQPHHYYEDRLVVGGEFDSAGSIATGPLALWDVSSDYWSRYNPGISRPGNAVYAITGQDPIEYRIAIGGDFDYIEDSSMVNHVVQFSPVNPIAWFPLGDGMIYNGGALEYVADVASDGHGDFYAVGRFNYAGGRLVNNVSRWDGERWWSLGEGVNAPLNAVVARDDTVYVAGNTLTSASGVPVGRVAMWDGAQWHDLGGGIPNGYFYELALDSAGNLYVSGDGIDSAGSVPVTGIAKWNGTEWEALGELGWPGSVNFVFDIYIDPDDQDVYVCGDFETADGIACNGVARWDGSSWFPLGDLDIGDGLPYAIERAPNGNIVVAGFIDRPELRQMTTPGFWEAYGGGIATLEVNDMLTVGCDFFLTGEPLQYVGSEDNPIPVKNVARFDGNEWLDLSGGLNVGGDVTGVAAYSNELAIGGRFRIAADKRANGFTIWKGLRNANADIGLFVSPNYDDTLFANEIYEVTWNAANTTAAQINLEISYDSGATWQTFAGNVDAQLGKIPWLVPDMEVTDCRMRISDSYAPCASRESWPFHIVAGEIDKVTWLRRFNGPFYQEPFVVGYHNWPFSNTRANLWSDSLEAIYPYPEWFLESDLPDSIESFPPWNLFVSAFGDDYCYRNGEPGRVRPRAMEQWKNLLGKWSGSCLGFSVSSLLWWEHNEFNTNIYIPDNYLFNFTLNTFERNMVNKHWIYQNGTKHREYNAEVRDYTPMQTLQAIRDDMPGYPRSLSFSWLSWKDKTDKEGSVVDSVLHTVGHNVVPYKIAEFDDSVGIYHMYFYDSNNPTSSSRYARIDSLTETWSIETYGIYDTTGRFVPRLPINEWIGLADDERKTMPFQRNLASYNFLLTSATEEILITDSSGGQVGWVNYAEVNTLAGSSPFDTDDPEYPYTYPKGYVLPMGQYAVELSKFEEEQSRLSIELVDAVHTYERTDADSTQTDDIYFADGITAVNHDAVAKKVSMTSIASAGDTDYYLKLDSLTFAQSDSTIVKVTPAGAVNIDNYGQAKQYNLILWYSSPTEESYTQSLAMIDVAANSSQQIEPVWNDLESGSLTILRDNDMNGSYEDTTIADVATAVGDEEGSLLPNSYWLGQNFPNPFNPTTTISFNLPTRSKVKLEVLNLLGQRVSVLADKTMAAGEHKFDWNGRTDAGEAVASGVYFYRLQANDFKSTRKMLLLK